MPDPTQFDLDPIRVALNHGEVVEFDGGTLILGDEGHCCVDGKRVWLIGVVPRSDGEGEFGEGRWEPMLWVEFHAEFVVAAADVLDECVSGTDHAGRAEPFEATHRPEPGRELSMIGLDQVIRVLLQDMARGWQQLIGHPRVGRCPVGAHLAGA
jgi:hypothetical protein